MLKRFALGLTLVAVMAAPSWAMDSLNMPTGNGLKPGDTEVNFIYVNQPHRENALGQTRLDDLRFLKFFTGVTDRLQVDVDTVDISHADSYWEVNAYYTLLKESADRPSLVLGATNLFGQDWLGGSDFGGNLDNDDPSLFGLAAYTVHKTAAPSLTDPMVRLHLGWGNNFHGDDFFGMVQVKLHPRVMLVAQNYKTMPTFIGTVQVTDELQVSAGTMDGYPFYRAGGVLSW